MRLTKTPSKTSVYLYSGDATKAPSKLGMLVLVTLLVTGIVACNLVMETNILSNRLDPLLPSINSSSNNDNITLVKETTCRPNTANVSAAAYHSGHRYYSFLRQMTPLVPPVFRDTHTMLCNDTSRNAQKYEYCLPISGRKDSPFCTGADRMDLLSEHSAQSHCYASVLHMLLIEVYEELYAFKRSPIVVYGSLLGAVRNGSMIPFTEDTDIAYSGRLDSNDEISRALVAKGYHIFFYGIWRVCVAPTHPLAARLYNSRLPIVPGLFVPYVDLYSMKKQNGTAWSMEGFRGSIVPTEKVLPFSQVMINGLSFDTVADPNYFLTQMYGSDYMTPKPRK